MRLIPLENMQRESLTNIHTDLGKYTDEIFEHVYIYLAKLVGVALIIECGEGTV